MNTKEKLPKLYGLAEVALMLDIPIGTLYNMKWQGNLQCFKIGRRIKMSEEQILSLIKKGNDSNDC